eukprot:2803192-Rhodomonas_salina.1
MPRVLRKGRHSPAMTAPHVPKMNGAVSMRKSRPRRAVVCALWEAFWPRHAVICALMKARSASRQCHLASSVVAGSSLSQIPTQ